MEHTITFIPGDGVGPEISEATRRVLEATGVHFVWEDAIIGSDAYEKFGMVLTVEAMESIKRNKVAI